MENALRCALVQSYSNSKIVYFQHMQTMLLCYIQYGDLKRLAFQLKPSGLPPIENHLTMGTKHNN